MQCNNLPTFGALSLLSFVVLGHMLLLLLL